MDNLAPGDRALAAYFLPFGEALGPKIRFSSYNLEGDNVNLDISLAVDEIDGVWNWIYFAYNHEEGKIMAAVKGGKTDLKTKMASGISHNVPT